MASRTERDIILERGRSSPVRPAVLRHHHTLMHIVVADSLPSSALDILKQTPEVTVDARSGRAASELKRDLADADALIVRSATNVTKR